MRLALILFVFFATSKVFAWGKQGHAIINQTAALILADSENKDFLREHAFDLSYFANVPDIAWKQEKTYNIEAPQHFMDLEVFEREIKIKKSKGPYKVDEAFFLDREEFEAKYPHISLKAGRSWWRTREIFDLLHKQSDFLADSKMSVKERHSLQAQWLVLAGVLGHYVGDLAQPLHLTENFDGQLSSQKGVHSFFEDKMVNMLIPKLSETVFNEAKKQWPAFAKANHDLSTLNLIANLSQKSRTSLKDLLAIDKKIKRKKQAEHAKAFEKIIVAQMVQGSLCLAELWRRNLDFKFNGQMFYTFISIPDYIYPGTSATAHIEEVEQEN